MTKVAVLGATGYTGLELLRILAAHPDAMVSFVSSRTNRGEMTNQVFPALTGLFEMEFQDTDPALVPGDVEIAFTCLPHKSAMEVVAVLLERGLRVVDFSADFRFKDPGTYEKWYQPHTRAQLLKDAVYGLPELYRDEIAKARLVANPGCYPTAVILGLAPLISKGLIDTGTIVVGAISGATGAGRGVSLALHFCEVNGSFRAYSVAEHRHTPEMEQELSKLAQREVKITFIPHLAPMLRGIFSTIYATLLKDLDTNALEELYLDFFRHDPFVRLIRAPLLPATNMSIGTNFVTLGLRVDKRTGRVVVMSTIDNLTRGASGQAVANMNLMLGLDETAGLFALPWRP